MASRPEMGGYQLPLALTMFRGRYRESLETAKAIEPGKVLEYEFPLPNANHTFQPGHRVMVQVQSTLFRSEEHTSELQSLMRISYAVFCLKKKNKEKYHV